MNPTEEMTPHKQFEDGGWINTEDVKAAVATKVEDTDNKKRWKEFAKSALLVGILVVLYLFSKVIGAQVTKTREQLVEFPLFWFIVLVLAIQMVRRNIPPIYMLFGPISSFFLVVLHDKIGPYWGAVVYQLLKIEELIIFLTLRWLYSDMSDKLMDESYELKYFSATFRRGLVHFDEAWRSEVFERSPLRQCSVIVMFSCTYFFNDYICLFWLSTRSKMDYKVYASSYLLAILIEYPKTLMKFRIYTGILDNATGQSEEDDPSMWDMPTAEIVLFCITVGIATSLVHGVHLKAVFMVTYTYLGGIFGLGTSRSSTPPKMMRAVDDNNIQIT